MQVLLFLLKIYYLKFTTNKCKKIITKFKHTVTGSKSTVYHIYQDHNRNLLVAVSKLNTIKRNESQKQYQNQMNRILSKNLQQMKFNEFWPNFDTLFKEFQIAIQEKKHASI